MSERVYKTRPTLLLSLSELQAEALARLGGADTVWLYELDREEKRRVLALQRRGMVNFQPVAMEHQSAVLTGFGFAALTAYRSAQSAGLLRSVS